MQNKTGFVAALFVLALCAWTIAAIDIYEFVDFERYSQRATMELADPDKEVVLYDDVLDMRALDVRYVGSAGDVVVRQKLLSLADAERLVAGEKIPIIYHTNNPKRTFSTYHQPGIPWVLLVLGFIVLATAIFALRLLKSEQRG